LRSYNGRLAGPTIRIHPGDTLRVDFKNSLPVDDCVEPQGAHSIPTCFNITNLHTHGLHVSPSGNSDNVLLELGPQSRMEYEYDLPKDHPAGTFWYHPHRHGSTALQVSSGMARALIVEGNRPVADKARNGIADIDTILKYTGGRSFDERIFLFQQISYACLDAQNNIITIQGIWSCLSGDTGGVEGYGPRYAPGAWAASGRFTTLNGKVQPTLRAEAGKIQRWRMIHAGVHDTIQLAVTASKILPPADSAALFALSQMGLAAQLSWTEENCLQDQVVPQWQTHFSRVTGAIR
jgi:L-ascorbate oxidase